MYRAPNPATALVEILVYAEIEAGDLPDALQYLEVEAPDTISTEPVDVDALGPHWQKNPVASRLAGDQWLHAGSAALLRVPSVIVPATWNVPFTVMALIRGCCDSQVAQPPMLDSERAALETGTRGRYGKSDMTTKTRATSAVKKRTRARTPQTVGESIIQGLKEAIEWTKGENDNVRVTLVHVPEVDVRKVRLKRGLSQAQFATKFGFPPATLRNWEQGRSHPDAPTRVLLAVIAKHPAAVEDVLRKAS